MIDQLTLRRRLEAVLQPHGLPGSLYMLALGSVYLAAPDDSDAEFELEWLYYQQAKAEELDGDDLLSTLVNLGVAP